MIFRKSSTFTAQPSRSINWSDSLSKGLVGWWPLTDRAGAKCIELTGKSLTGSLTGAQTWVPGYQGGGFQFGNTNTQGFDLGLPPQMEVDYLTACAWVKLMVTAPPYLSWLGRRGPSGQVWTFSIDNTNKLYNIVWNSGGSLNVANSGAALTVGVWYHLAVTYDGVTIRNYINGKPDGTASLSGVTQKSTAEHPYIGYSPWEFNSLNAVVSDVRFYNRAMTQSEIQQIMFYPWRPIYSPRYGMLPLSPDVVANPFRPKILFWE